MAGKDHQRERKVRPGGPQTVAGKQASRGNALKHGFTSKKLLPEILNRDRVGEFRRQFRQQYQPQNPTEEILVDELARHAAMLELGEQSEGAVLRHGARELSDIILGPAKKSGEGNEESEDAILSVAVSTDALDKFNRYRRGHEKAFFAALMKLREIQAERRQTGKASTDVSVRKSEAFATEAACKEFLIDRLQHRSWRCPRCSHSHGSWLKQRNRWECAKCRRQTGLRYGTVMQGSRLALRIWFRAITLMLTDPGMSTATLADTLSLNRLETVRNMRKKIHRALESENAHELLMGLTNQPGGSTGVTP